jgi:hypothetical protein
VSYPQPNADQYALNGYQYFRLNTLLSSPGDIYESAQGALGFALGPESDISRVAIAYFDDQVPTTMTNQTVISPDRSFVGRVDARNEVTYQPSGRPGRVLMWSGDIYDQTYVPSAAVGYVPGQPILRIRPRLDVLQYFRDMPSLVPARVDRQYDFQSYQLVLGTNWIVVPTYGRRYGYVQIANRPTVPPVAPTFRVIGVNYGIGPVFHMETVIFSGALAPGAQINVNDFLGAGGIGSGMYDAVVFTAEGDHMPMRVYLSDKP